MLLLAALLSAVLVSDSLRMKVSKTRASGFVGLFILVFLLSGSRKKDGFEVILRQCRLSCCCDRDNMSEHVLKIVQAQVEVCIYDRL